MEEYHRRSKQRKKNGFSSLPPIQHPQRPLKQVLNTENAFKLCRVGVKKTKFINFDLKYTENQNQLVPPQQNIKMPLMVFNKNKFSPFREESPRKAPHLLLISRIKQSESLPSIARNDYSYIKSAKFTKEKDYRLENPHLFIT